MQITIASDGVIEKSLGALLCETELGTSLR
jgi:hypothetical protein